MIQYALLALLAGLGIPIMAALNAALGARLGSTAAAAVILFLVAFVAAGLFLAFSGKVPSAARLPGSSFIYLYAGGLFVAFYVLSITWLVPRFGVGNAVFFVLLGQMVSTALIDHFGLLGAPRIPLSTYRVLGILLIVAGIFMAVRSPSAPPT